MSKSQILLTDIVNLNADASCLSSESWLNILKGGSDSYLCKWLSIYVTLNKKVSLGLTGATIADMSVHNPESIFLINKHKNIFEIILRPFSHDVAMLRSAGGFKLNLAAGIKVINKEFGNYQNFFLPPEFMLTNEQVYLLKQFGVEGTFINADRFKTEIRNRLPDKPYYVKGLLGSELKCIPVVGELTQSFLHGIHHYDAEKWNGLLQANNNVNFSWRDGESSFFIPDGNDREYAWLSAESSGVKRLFLSEALPETKFDNNKHLKKNHYHYYPVHSFTPWMKEFRMMGFVQKLMTAEQNLKKYSKQQASIWLQAINSDILSSIEKDSPVVNIKLKKNDTALSDYTIWRCERGLEGEECLAQLTRNFKSQEINHFFYNSFEPYIIKLKGRIQYLKKIL